MKLRELIRQVRSCKTAAEERSVIAKECAEIRTAIKTEDSPYRHRNLAKLLFINMLGYPTHFGQMECLKLVASEKFTEKRVGYLALTLLLDEKQEVLMLVTNSIKKDLNHDNPYVIGLALAALANVSSAEIARDLASEICRLLQKNNSFIKKKAALTALRFIRKAPELVDDFIGDVHELLHSKNHGVLLSGVSLAIEIVKLEPELAKKSFLPMISDMLRLLRNLASGYAPEHEISGVADPFLQTKLIKFIRLLLKDEKKVPEELTDILSTVASNTETQKNAGNAILYECVETIMSIPAEASLRVMAINILGRFLLNRDNNIRYVALNTLSRCVKDDVKAMQRHRNTVVDCLKDPDISIRRRALELIYSLVNKSNVKALVRELINYLVLASGDVEFHTDLTEKVTTVIDRFSPDPLWQIDTLIRVLQAAGNLTQENVPASLIALISQHEEYQAYAAHKLFQCIRTDTKQVALVNVAVWTIGEYGMNLVSSDGYEKASSLSDEVFQRVDERHVLDVFKNILTNPNTPQTSKEYLLSALVKLSVRFAGSKDDIAALTKTLYRSAQLELQSRSCEYGSLMSKPFDALRNEIVAPVPALDPEYVRNKIAETHIAVAFSDGENEEPELPEEKKKTKKKTKRTTEPAPVVDLFDIDSLLSESVNEKKPPTSQAVSSSDDLLASLFPISTAPTEKPASLVAEDLTSLSLFPPSSGSMQAPQISASPELPSSVVFDSDELKIVFEFLVKSADKMTVVMKSFATSNVSFENYQILVAVPTYLKLKMYPASGNQLSINTNSQIVQNIDLEHTMAGQKPYAVRLKVDGKVNGTNWSQTIQFAKFPTLA